MRIGTFFNCFWLKAFSCFWSLGLMVNVLFSNLLIAQDKVIRSIDWHIAARLPETDQSEKQLGVAGPVVGLIQNKLLIAGGANFPDKMPWYGGGKKLYNHIYVYQKDENGNIKGLSSAQRLPNKLAYSASASTTRGIVFIGGETENGLSDKAILIQMSENNSSLEFKELPPLPFSVTNAAAVAIKNKIYLAGGEIANHEVSEKLLMLDMEVLDKGWQQKAKLPKKLSHLMLVANEENLYVVGGRKSNAGNITDFSSSVYCYDVRKNEWIAKASLPYALSAGTSVVFGKEILVFGGDRGNTFHKAELTILGINNETDTLKKNVLNQIKVDIQNNHPGFSDEVLSYNIGTNEWRSINPIKFRVPVTTQAIKWDNFIFIPTGEVRAGVRTSQILRGKVNY